MWQGIPLGKPMLVSKYIPKDWVSKKAVGKLDSGPSSSPGPKEGDACITKPGFDSLQPQGIEQLTHATTGSAGFDLTTVEPCEFQFPQQVYKIRADVKGPLPAGTFGLLLPCSSTSQRGLFVIPGVIDSDYTGQLIIQAWSNLPQSLPSGEQIAQLVILPYCQGRAQLQQRHGGFGSTKVVAAATLILHEKPMMALRVGSKTINGLLDTGADVTVIAQSEWPVELPTIPTQEIWGVWGGYRPAQRSATALTIQSISGNTAIQLTPYILPIPFSIWGWDLLSQLQTTLQTNLS